MGVQFCCQEWKGICGQSAPWVTLPKLAPLQAVAQNKMLAFMTVWLVGNMVQSAFVQTQAFEIYVEDKVVWSTGTCELKGVE